MFSKNPIAEQMRRLEEQRDAQHEAARPLGDHGGEVRLSRGLTVGLKRPGIRALFGGVNPLHDDDDQIINEVLRLKRG